ncbi:hypothetical protein [Flavobacterium piscis]|uniref:Secreted protein n=1 Tax=Flavobacterium piscis TaxID=1114874 RepID=A0ABU1Y3E2_9FLAO|nr:hypothetical protein [Flavobacterium piscis]MDR7208740.1 hypothetical protein [Flavobacterium piscis]
MRLPNQTKSNFNLKFFLLLFLVALVNINCEHCDDEDYIREQEENTTVKQPGTKVLNK